MMACLIIMSCFLCAILLQISNYTSGISFLFLVIGIILSILHDGLTTTTKDCHCSKYAPSDTSAVDLNHLFNAQHPWDILMNFEETRSRIIQLGIKLTKSNDDKSDNFEHAVFTPSTNNVEQDSQVCRPLLEQKFEIQLKEECNIHEEMPMIMQAQIVADLELSENEDAANLRNRSLNNRQQALIQDACKDTRESKAVACSHTDATHLKFVECSDAISTLTEPVACIVTYETQATPIAYREAGEIELLRPVVCSDWPTAKASLGTMTSIDTNKTEIKGLSVRTFFTGEMWKKPIACSDADEEKTTLVACSDEKTILHVFVCRDPDETTTVFACGDEAELDMNPVCCSNVDEIYKPGSSDDKSSNETGTSLNCNDEDAKDARGVHCRLTQGSNNEHWCGKTRCSFNGVGNKTTSNSSQPASIPERVRSEPTVSCERSTKKAGLQKQKSQRYRQLLLLRKLASLRRGTGTWITLVVANFIALGSTFCECNLIVKPQPSLVQLGETATFDCTTNYPVAPVTWWRMVSGLSQDIYVGGEIFAKRGSRFKVINNINTREYRLSIENVTAGDAGTYTCTDFRGAGEESSAELVVLLSSPVLTKASRWSVLDQQLMQTELSATFEYRGRAALVARWIVTHRNGTLTNHSSSQDTETKIGNYTKIVSNFIVLPEDQTEIVRCQICGKTLSCTPELYLSYYEYYDTVTPASTISSDMVPVDSSNSMDVAASLPSVLQIVGICAVILVSVGLSLAFRYLRVFKRFIFKILSRRNLENEVTQLRENSDTSQSLLQIEAQK